MRVWWLIFIGPLLGAIALTGGMLPTIAALALCVVVWLAFRRSRPASTKSEYEPLSNLLCSDVIDPDKEALQPDITCASALQQMIESGRRTVPVVVGRRFLGILELNDFAKLVDRELAYVYVGAIMSQAAEIPSLDPTATAMDAFKRLYECGRHELPVLNDSTFAGLVSRESLQRALAASKRGRSLRSGLANVKPLSASR